LYHFCNIAIPQAHSGPIPQVKGLDLGCFGPRFVLDFWGFGVGMGFEPIFCL